MKNLNLLLLTLVLFLSFIFYSCHTETPVNVDHENPSVGMKMVYNTADTLYNSDDSTLAFVDFNFDGMIVEGDYRVLISVDDNQGLFKVSLFAEDAVNNDSYLIGSKMVDDNGELEFVIDRGDFPVVQDDDFQKFFLYLNVSDEAENTSSSSKLGFYVVKESIFEKMYYTTGLFEEIQGDSVDFRERIGKLTFIQFMAAGWLSCHEEAVALQEMYESNDYDNSKFAHLLFGDYSFQKERTFKEYKSDNALPYDCFWDVPEGYVYLDEEYKGPVKSLMETETNNTVLNDVFAVMPNGILHKYDIQTDVVFEDWIHEMYDLANLN